MKYLLWGLLVDLEDGVQFPIQTLVTLAQLVERLTFNQVVMGSSPICDIIVCVAQMVERLAFNWVVAGSSPVTDTLLGRYCVMALSRWSSFKSYSQ